MTGLSTKFRAVILGAACLAGAAACSKPPVPTKQEPEKAAVTLLQAAPERDDPATTPKDASLQGFWMSYSEVDKRADLNYDRNLQAEDKQPISSVTISLPKGFPTAQSSEDYGAMKVRNKALLDFMSACIGPDNTKAITQMSEGIIAVYTTPLTLRNTIEITHIAPGQKTFITDAVLGCNDQPKADAAVMKLKADNALTRR